MVLLKGLGQHLGFPPPKLVGKKVGFQEPPHFVDFPNNFSMDVLPGFESKSGYLLGKSLV